MLNNSEVIFSSSEAAERRYSLNYGEVLQQSILEKEAGINDGLPLDRVGVSRPLNISVDWLFYSCAKLDVFQATIP